MKKTIPIMPVRRLRTRTKAKPYIDAPPGIEPVRQLLAKLLAIKGKKKE
jgi:hypothetical protein